MQNDICIFEFNGALVMQTIIAANDYRINVGPAGKTSDDDPKTLHSLFFEPKFQVFFNMMIEIQSPILILTFLCCFFFAIFWFNRIENLILMIFESQSMSSTGSQIYSDSISSNDIKIKCSGRVRKERSVCRDLSGGEWSQKSKNFIYKV
jgi:hypothetical protein